MFKLVFHLYYDFFLKRLKWNILPHKSVNPRTRSVEEKQQGLYKIYKGKQKLAKRIQRKEKLAYAQYGERTKPPAMQIEGKSNVLRLQPHIGDGLNPINHLKYGANLQPVVSFLSDFPNSCIPYNL